MLQILQTLKRFLQHILRRVKQRLGHPPSSPRATRRAIHWALGGKLAVAAFPQPGDADELLKANIKVVLSLCSELEATLPEDITENFKCLRLVLPDRYYKEQITVEQLTEAVALVREQIENGLPVYVHCLAGIERSPTVCIAYLCKYHNMELWEALNWLKQVHPPAQPNASGLRAIREFLQQQDSRGAGE